MQPLVSLFFAIPISPFILEKFIVLDKGAERGGGKKILAAHKVRISTIHTLANMD